MNMKALKAVRIIFAVRAVLWVVALTATIYWISWSFKIYAMEIYDPYDYAALFRPVFQKGMLIALIALAICLILRRISDTVKKVYDLH